MVNAEAWLSGKMIGTEHQGFKEHNVVRLESRLDVEALS